MIARIAFLFILVAGFGSMLSVWQTYFGFYVAQKSSWVWMWEYAKHYGQLPDFALYSVYVMGCIMIIIIFVVQLAMSRLRNKTIFGDNEQNNLHGSARWAKKKDIIAAGLLGNEGVVVGGWNDKILYHNGPEHVMAFAPTRSGKGVGLVIPTLLSWKHSTIVLDIKGENHALTAGYRASIGQRVLKFEPTALNGSVSFNPLAEIRKGTDYEIADTQNIASMIIDPEGKGLRDFWMKSGFAWLTAGILHVLYRIEKEHNRAASLKDVSLFMSATAKGGIETLLEDMISFKHGRAPVDELVGATAQEMFDRAPNERSGVHSSALTELALYRDPVVAGNITKSDFCLNDLMNAENPTSLYLVIPPSDIDRLRPLIRVIMNLLLKRLTTDMTFENGTQKQTYKHRLLLMLDEFTSIGKLEIFERALAFMAGYGIKTFIIVQDLAQLQKEYGREESVISNCHVRIAYAPNKVETAKVLSEMAGKTTLVQKKRSRSTSTGQLVGNTSESLAEISRPLLTPDECMQLPGMEKAPDGSVKKPGDMLIFPAGFPPIYGRQVLFFTNPDMATKTRMSIT